jgi:hypothetical protein
VNVAKVTVPGWATVPPWTVKRPTIDTALTQEISKHEQPAVLASLAREKIAGYGDNVQIYTDASKNSAGRVSIGCK